MPRKSKDELNKIEKINDLKSTKSSNKSVKKSNTDTTKKAKSNTSEKNIKTKKDSISVNNVNSKTKSKNTTSATKKSSASKKSSKAVSSKKKGVTKKDTNTKKNASNKTKRVSPIVEYYDLPFRYNETVVKILAQTPTMLFIYWDISDSDRKLYIDKYGEDFFYKTKPVLLVTNKTMNYHFEVEINDFANSWYLHVNDADCDYSVELGRRPIEYSSNIDNYVYITTSNDMEMPNNHILFDKLGRTVFFKNVKNNFIEEKEISSISYIRNIGKLYGIYDLYMEMYKNEINIEDITSNNINLNLSSSNSSTFK